MPQENEGGNTVPTEGDENTQATSPVAQPNNPSSDIVDGSDANTNQGIRQPETEGKAPGQRLDEIPRFKEVIKQKNDAIARVKQLEEEMNQLKGTQKPTGIQEESGIQRIKREEFGLKPVSFKADYATVNELYEDFFSKMLEDIRGISDHQTQLTESQRQQADEQLIAELDLVQKKIAEKFGEDAPKEFEAFALEKLKENEKLTITDLVLEFSLEKANNVKTNPNKSGASIIAKESRSVNPKSTSPDGSYIKSRSMDDMVNDFVEGRI